MQSIQNIPINVFYLCFHAYSRSLNANWQHGTTYPLNLSARSMPVSTVSTPAQLPFSAHFKRCELAEQNPHHGDLKSSNISKKSKLETFSQLRKESLRCKCFLTPQCICPEMDGREKFSSIFPNDFCEIRHQSFYPNHMSNTRKVAISTDKVLMTRRLSAYLICVTTPPPSQV